MSSRPWYPWFPADYLADTRMLTLEEHGAYRLLLDALWVDGPLEDSDLVRAKVLAQDPRRSRRLWRQLRHYFDVSNGRFDHTKLAKLRAEAIEKSGKYRVNGSKGGQATAQANAAARAAANAQASRARPDPEPYQPSRVTPGLNLNPDDAASQQNPALSPEQRTELDDAIAALPEAEREVFAVARRRREAAAAGDGPIARLATIAGQIAGQPGNPVTRDEDENS